MMGLGQKAEKAFHLTMLNTGCHFLNFPMN
nr:MAG TPA: hypothetical protein [Caudoviricetes sp.]